MIYLFWGIIALMTLGALAIVLWPLLFNRKLVAIVIILVALPVFSIMLYWHLGANQALQQYWAQKKQAKRIKAELQQLKNPEQLIHKLQLFLEKNPQRAKGWYLLGKLYFGMHNYQQANQALLKAHLLKPTNVDYAVSYAEASFFLNHQSLLSSVKKLIEQIIRQQPNNVAAVNLLAINAYLQKDYQQAIRSWQSLLPLFREKSSDRKMLLIMINRAKKQNEKVLRQRV